MEDLMMNKIKRVILTTILSLLTGCQLASDAYIQQDDSEKFIGVALTYVPLNNDQQEDDQYLILYSKTLDYEVPDEVFMIEHHVSIEDENNITNIKAAVYPYADEEPFLYSISLMYKINDEIVLEKVSSNYLFENEMGGALTYTQDDKDLQLNIEVLVQPQTKDDSIMIYEYDEKHELRNTLTVDDFETFEASYDYFLVEYRKKDGSVKRHLNTEPLYKFKDGNDFLIYEVMHIE